MQALAPLASLLLLLAIGGGSAVAQTSAPPAGRTLVIVHGAWGGSWAFKQVDSLLTAQGHTVYRPSLTGLGERVHLATPDVDLSTHIQDVVNTILYEELRDVVLVGHSYGGMVISGVADRVPDRIQRLVYLDAFLPEHGESVIGKGGGAPMGLPVRDGFVVPTWRDPDQPPPGDVPHPLKTLTEPISLENPAARNIPATYILTVDPGAETDSFSRFADRARARGWPVIRMEADHNPQWSKPRELVELLHAAATGR